MKEKSLTPPARTHSPQPGCGWTNSVSPVWDWYSATQLPHQRHCLRDQITYSHSTRMDPMRLLTPTNLSLASSLLQFKCRSRLPVQYQPMLANLCHSRVMQQEAFLPSPTRGRSAMVSPRIRQMSATPSTRPEL